MAYLQRHSAEPLRNRIDVALTTFLLSEFGSITSTELDFDTSNILALQEAKNDLHDRVRADYEAGAITLNQFLAETGRPVLGPSGDVYKVPFTVSFLSLKELHSPSIAPLKQMEMVEEKLMALPAASSTDPLPELETAFAPTKAKLTEIGTRKLSQLVGGETTDFEPYRVMFMRLYGVAADATIDLLGVDKNTIFPAFYKEIPARIVTIYDGIARDIANTPDPTDLLSSDYRTLLTKTIAQEIEYAHTQVLRLCQPS